MKKTILSLVVVCFSLAASAQIDSTKMKVSLTLQTRDWLYISQHIKHTDEFERLYDSIKLRIYPVTNPYSTATGTIDSISVGNLLTISRAMRSRSYGVVLFPFTRINTAIRAINNAYLQSQLDVMDDYYIDLYNNGLSGELDRLKKVRQ